MEGRCGLFLSLAGCFVEPASATEIFQPYSPKTINREAEKAPMQKADNIEVRPMSTAVAYPIPYYTIPYYTIPYYTILYHTIPCHAILYPGTLFQFIRPLYLRGPELLTMWFGESEANVREVFDKALGKPKALEV